MYFQSSRCVLEKYCFKEKYFWQSLFGVKLQASFLQVYYNNTPSWVFSSENTHFSYSRTTAFVLSLIKLLYSAKSKFSAIFSQTFFSLFINWKFIYFLSKYLFFLLIEWNHFYQHKNYFNIVSKIFFPLICMWVKLWKKLAHSL